MTKRVLYLIILIALIISCRHTNEPETVAMVFCLGTGFSNDSVSVKIDDVLMYKAKATTQEDGIAWLTIEMQVSRTNHSFSIAMPSSNLDENRIFYIETNCSIIAHFDRSNHSIAWERVDYLIKREKMYL